MIKLENINMDFKSEITDKMQHVLKDISMEVNQGDCLAILGESGSGKSTLGRILIGLLKPTSGKYYFMDKEPYKNKKDKKFLSKNVSVVFQDYNTSVNPRFTVREIIGESLTVLQKKSKQKINKLERTIEYLNAVGLNESYLDRFPHQLSGGQLQRVCIARAIAIEPKVILFDEAISSLDAHTQVQIMDLLREIQHKYSLTYLFITHDLTSVTYLCNRVMFLYQGKITEMIDVEEIAITEDEYAKRLLSTIIDI